MTLLLARKDLRTMWASPVPWVVGAAFHVVLGLLYVDQLEARGQAVVQPLFPIAGFLLLLIVPVLTMRALAEETKAGTLDVLLAIPVGAGPLVIGKWLACWTTALVIALPAGLSVLLLRLWGNPDWGPVVAGFIGLVLLSATASAIGVLASAVTASQPVAAMVATFINLLLWLADFGSSTPLGGLFVRLSLREALRGFAGGAIDSADTATFAIMGVAAVFAAVTAVDARRMR
jgi:ABC-2 type transport system permease protein